MSARMESQEGTSRAAESKPHPYDVFINHRGPDVKNTFVSHLDAALRRDGLRPFLDARDIEQGRHVFNSIDEAIKGSCVHVAIFSERYAESKHCLNELCDMLKTGKKILPVFYHVDPGDLRMIKNGPFKEGFTKLIERETELTEGEIEKWKEALCKISHYMGLQLAKVNGDEWKLVRRIVKEVRRLVDLMPDKLLGAIEGTDTDTEAPGPEQPDVTFNPGDRRLNILALGDPGSVEAVIRRICGAGRRETLVEDHVNLRERRNSSPPMCLYRGTQEINTNDFTRDIRTFVKVRNDKWRREKVKALWLKEVVRECPGPQKPGPRKPGLRKPALFPDSTLRLHAIWFVCRNLSDLPNHLDWLQITKKLCDLPVQILVTQDLDMNVEEEFNKIRKYGGNLFPNAQMFMEDLIVKVALQDDDLNGKLWRKCWAVKTRAEIGNAAKIIWKIRRQLGSAGKSVQRFGGLRMSKKVSLSRSGEFVLNFLCMYWDIPQDSLRLVLQRRTNFISQARGSKISIEPCKFVEFCLIVAAIILYDAQDNASEPNVISESSLDQLLRTEAREFYNSYFGSSTSLYYDKMKFKDIRRFLESIFERKGWDPASVDRDSFISKIMKRICPRGISVSPGMTPS